MHVYLLSSQKYCDGLRSTVKPPTNVKKGLHIHCLQAFYLFRLKNNVPGVAVDDSVVQTAVEHGGLRRRNAGW